MISALGNVWHTKHWSSLMRSHRAWNISRRNLKNGRWDLYHLNLWSNNSSKRYVRKCFEEPFSSYYFFSRQISKSFTCKNSMKSAWPSGQGRRLFHFCRVQVRVRAVAIYFFFHFFSLQNSVLKCFDIICLQIDNGKTKKSLLGWRDAMTIQKIIFKWHFYKILVLNSRWIHS